MVAVLAKQTDHGMSNLRCFSRHFEAPLMCFRQAAAADNFKKIFSQEKEFELDGTNRVYMC